VTNTAICACGRPKDSPKRACCLRCYGKLWRERNVERVREYDRERYKPRHPAEDGENKLWALRKATARALIRRVQEIAPDFTDEQISAAISWYVAEKRILRAARRTGQCTESTEDGALAHRTIAASTRDTVIPCGGNGTRPADPATQETTLEEETQSENIPSTESRAVHEAGWSGSPDQADHA
jgi:hypothetical protein